MRVTSHSDNLTWVLQKQDRWMPVLNIHPLCYATRAGDGKVGDMCGGRI